MISIPWHLIAFILAEGFLIYKMVKRKHQSLDFVPFLYLAAVIIIAAVYGGIFWY